MTYTDRSAQERFLAEVNVGVLNVADAASTLATPIWYRYEPGGHLEVITSARSRKGRAIHAAGRFGVVAQVATLPYRYVSVEGPVVETRPAAFEHDILPMAVRYLGQASGKRYAAAWRDGGIEATRVFTMRPERWFAADLTDEFASLGLLTPDDTNRPPVPGQPKGQP